MNKEFDIWIHQELGALQLFSNVEHPWENGRAERSFQTIFGRRPALCLNMLTYQIGFGVRLFFMQSSLRTEALQHALSSHPCNSAVGPLLISIRFVFSAALPKSSFAPLHVPTRNLAIEVKRASSWA